MNKEKLNKYLKTIFTKEVYFSIEIINKIVCFNLYGYDNREVCIIEIPYKSRLDKKAIYTTIADLVKRFDFSFRVVFNNTKEIYDFLEV